MKKIVLMNLNLHEDQENGSYSVEAKPNNRWVEVGGPFNNRNKAVDFAQKYAIANHVRTRVVTTQ